MVNKRRLVLEFCNIPSSSDSNLWRDAWPDGYTPHPPDGLAARCLTKNTDLLLLFRLGDIHLLTCECSGTDNNAGIGFNGKYLVAFERKGNGGYPVSASDIGNGSCFRAMALYDGNRFNKFFTVPEPLTFKRKSSS